MAGNRERNVALVKVLAAAAWADGKLDTEEVNRLKELMLAYEMNPGEMGEVQTLLDAPVSYSRCEELTRDLLGMLASPGERDAVLREVESILRADGEFTEDEQEVLAGLRGIMDAMTSVDGFMNRITGVFRRAFTRREGGGSPGELTEYLKNTVLHRLDDLSEGSWRGQFDAATLNRFTLFGAVLGRVARAEGGISPEELDRTREILSTRFRIQPPLLDLVVQAVEESAAAHIDRQGLLSEYNRVSDSEARKELLDAAFAVAAADGTVSKGELEELRLISNFLWIDPREYNAVRLKWMRA
jgi:uncharacterized tellurite resistance protein B-like protein